MDFEQIKNQYINKGREALNYIRDLPKISELIGIPYAKEVNQFVDRGIQGGFEKGAKGFGEMFEAYKPTVIPNIQSGFTTTFKDPSIARRELLDTNLVIQNYPSVKAKEKTNKTQLDSPGSNNPAKTNKYTNPIPGWLVKSQIETSRN